MSNTTRFKQGDSVIFQTVANETVIINLENGRYYSLNPTGSVIWEELVKGANPQEISLLFQEHMNHGSDVVAHAIAEFVNELIAEDLLTPAPIDAADPRPVPSAPNRVRFGTPTLEKFTDMEELIPLDPIHQVGTLGWPHRIQDEPTSTM